MPVPSPNETQEHFIDRCMGYPDLQDKPPAQRLAICHSLWREHYKNLEAMTLEELLALDNYIAVEALGIVRPFQKESTSSGEPAVVVLPPMASATPTKITVEFPPEFFQEQRVSEQRAEGRHKELVEAVTRIADMRQPPVIVTPPIVQVEPRMPEYPPVPPATVQIDVSPTPIQVTVPEIIVPPAEVRVTMPQATPPVVKVDVHVPEPPAPPKRKRRKITVARDPKSGLVDSMTEEELD